MKKPAPRGYPEAPETLGQHLRKRRMDLGLLQRELALTLGVAEGTVQSWEVDRTQPPVQIFPAILRFLGYTPWRAPASFSERLVHYRRANGLTQPQLAAVLGVHLATINSWETGKRRPGHKLSARVERVIGTGRGGERSGVS